MMTTTWRIAAACVAGLALCGPRAAMAGDEAVRIVCIGDSITQGRKGDPGESLDRKHTGAPPGRVDEKRQRPRPAVAEKLAERGERKHPVGREHERHVADAQDRVSEHDGPKRDPEAGEAADVEREGARGPRGR